MGFRPEPKRYKLNFKDSDYEGLEVTMGSVSIGEFNTMLRDGMVTEINDETLAANDKLLELFASRLVSWNLEDAKGKAVPTTIAAVCAQERSLIASIITGWQIAMITVPKGSVTKSENGVISPEDLAALVDSSSPGSLARLSR